LSGVASKNSSWSFAPNVSFTRDEWAALGDGTLPRLPDAELAMLGGLNERASREDVADIYMPLARLLGMHIAGARNLRNVGSAFFGRQAASAPFIIGVAGSVAVGKSTFARLLRAVLALSPNHPRVDLITTDGFLYPTRVLEGRGLLRRKGFPESYDRRLMLSFLADAKAGIPNLQVPLYSHETYDILEGRFDVVNRPDVIVFEGLNVLQTSSSAPVVASDYFDFSIYLDAYPPLIEHWYVQRFLLLQRTVFQRPSSYFHRYRNLSQAEAEAVAAELWQGINLPDLASNIQPTRERARLVVRKGVGHLIEEVRVRLV